MNKFDGRVAVVTGAGGGVGRGIAAALADEGLKLVLADINPALLDATTKEFCDRGHAAIGVVTDVADATAVDALATAALDAFGAIHVVCNNAGVFTPGLSWELDLAEWQFAVNVNLWGVIHGIRSFVPILLKQGEGGHVVNTASSAGLFGPPYCGPYVATKHAVVGLSKALRAEFAAQGHELGVSVLCPGPIQSALLDTALARAEESARAAGRAPRTEVMGQGNPNKRIPADIAGQAVAAAVRENRFWVLPNAEEHLEFARQEAAELFAAQP